MKVVETILTALEFFNKWFFNLVVLPLGMGAIVGILGWAIVGTVTCLAEDGEECLGDTPQADCYASPEVFECRNARSPLDAAGTTPESILAAHEDCYQEICFNN